MGKFVIEKVDISSGPVVFFLGLVFMKEQSSLDEKIAGIAQLIERSLAKAEVAGLSPVSRSKFSCLSTESFDEKTLFPTFSRLPGIYIL